MRRWKPELQRRHFELIAATICGLPDDVREVVAKAFARELIGTNANFDSSRFLLACEPRRNAR